MGNISAYDTRNYATFNPLSMQEIFLPAQQMREQHDKLAEEYAAQEQAGGLSLLGLKEGIDDEAIKIHQNYMAETKKAADELATKGFVDSGRRKNLYALKQQYNHNVVPLENQLKIRQQRAEEYRRQAMDRNWIGGRNPNEVSLTEGLKNPDAFNYQGVNANQMAETLGNKMTPYAQQLLSTGAIKKHKHPYAYQAILSITQGVDPNIVMAAMQDNPEALKDPAAKKLYNDMQVMLDQTLQEYKFSDIAPIGSEAYNRGRMITARGFSKGIGNVSIQNAQDQYGMQMAAEERAARKAKEESDIRRARLYGSEEMSSVFSPGYTNDIARSLSQVRTGEAGFSNLTLPSTAPKFKDGKLIKASQMTKGAEVNFSGKSFEEKDKPFVDHYNKVKSAIDIYRNSNQSLRSASDETVYKTIMKDPNYMTKIMSETQHRMLPVADEDVSNYLVSKAFNSASVNTTFVDYDHNYSKDISSGIDLDQIARRSGFKNKDQLNDYIKKYPRRVKKDINSGLFTIEIPTNVKSVNKDGTLTYEDDRPTSRVVGFSTGDAHSESVKRISEANTYRNNWTSGSLSPMVLSDNNGNAIVVKPKYNKRTNEAPDGTVTLTYEDGSSKTISYDGYVRLLGRSVDESEVFPAYDIVTQKISNKKILE